MISHTLPEAALLDFASLIRAMLTVLVWCNLTYPATGQEIAFPRVLADSWELELVAREPEIVTPVAMAFDQRGRLLVVESHTHFRPEEYAGPPTDRIRAWDDSNGDGNLDRWSTFYEGSVATMGLTAAPDGNVYASTRNKVLRLKDTTRDGRADDVETIIHLETEADYPHNGVGGIHYADSGFDGLRALIIGVGENLGQPYTIVGKNGERLHHSSGQGGSVYTYFLNQEQGALLRVATGFWNPFAICAGPAGALLAVDNDPDSSPPCRLLHLLPAADFGFRYQYGRTGLHPLQCWDGELPGTLPMICGVGEAPSAIVYHRGFIWVTSWGDHTIERYELTAKDGTFTAERTAVVQGGTDFRPVGMAAAEDGSMYFSDWVDRSYTLHGKGRIWRMRPTPKTALLEKDYAELKTWENQVDQVENREELLKSLRFRQEVILGEGLREFDDPSFWKKSPHAIWRLVLLQRLRWNASERGQQVLADALLDEDAEVRLFAVRWITDENLTDYRDEIERLLDGDIPSERYFLTVLAAIDWLSREPEMRGHGFNDALLWREIQNENRSRELKTLAFRLLSPDHEELTVDILRHVLSGDDEPLKQEAVRTLAMQSNPERLELLAELAANDGLSETIRADAVAGLAAAAREHEELLKSLAAGNSDVVRFEAVRALRLVDPSRRPKDAKPPVEDLDAWQELLDGPGDAESGRRLFFGAYGARCGVCHAHGGRGGRIGPELTNIREHRSREQIVQSILQPSTEMAPRYVPWVLETTDGRVVTGLRAPQGGDGGKETYFDVNGDRFTMPSVHIETRAPATTSIMPAGIEQTITIQDLRDLLAFLTPAEP